MQFEIQKEVKNTVHILLSGEVVSSSDFQFAETYLQQKKSLLIDLSGITYINSSGFGALVEETMNFRDAKLHLGFCGLNPTIRKTLDILGARELLDFKD